MGPPKTGTNQKKHQNYHNSFAFIFLHFVPATSIYYEFWLLHWIIISSVTGQSENLGFNTTLNWKQCLVDYKIPRQTHLICTFNFLLWRVGCLNSHNLRSKLAYLISMLFSGFNKTDKLLIYILWNKNFLFPCFLQ